MTDMNYVGEFQKTQHGNLRPIITARFKDDVRRDVSELDCVVFTLEKEVGIFTKRIEQFRVITLHNPQDIGEIAGYLPNVQKQFSLPIGGDRAYFPIVFIEQKYNPLLGQLVADLKNGHQSH